jgi:hypothetical protein
MSLVHTFLENFDFYNLFVISDSEVDPRHIPINSFTHHVDLQQAMRTATYSSRAVR